MSSFVVFLRGQIFGDPTARETRSAGNKVGVLTHTLLAITDQLTLITHNDTVVMNHAILMSICVTQA